MLNKKIIRKIDDIVYQGCNFMNNDSNFGNTVISRQEFKENGFSRLSKFYLI